jgi:hypothetical protein
MGEGGQYPLRSTELRQWCGEGKTGLLSTLKQVRERFAELGPVQVAAPGQAQVQAQVRESALVWDWELAQVQGRELAQVRGPVAV